MPVYILKQNNKLKVVQNESPTGTQLESWKAKEIQKTQ